MQTQTKKGKSLEVHHGYHWVFIILAVFTVLEVIASYLPLGLKLPLLVILAITKVLLVLLFFMHLKYDRPIFAAPFIIAIILAVPIILIFVLVMPHVQ